MDLGTGSAVLGTERCRKIVRNSSLGRVGFFPKQKNMGFGASSSISVEKNGLDVVIKKVVLDVVVLKFVRCGTF